MNIDNIKPTVWGPPAWEFLHYVTLTYPNNPTEEEKNTYKNFFITLGNILPCFSCRVNYNNHQNKYPLNDNVLSSKMNLVKWLFNIHNEVNMMNNKKVINLEEFFNIYLKGEKNQNKSFDIMDYLPNKKIILIISLLIIIILLCFIFKKYSNRTERDLMISRVILVD